MAPTLTTKQLQQVLETSRGKSYAVTGVTALLVIFLTLLGVFPAVSAIFFQISQNQLRQAAVAQVDQKRNTLRALIEQEQTKQQVTAALEYAFPDGFAQSSAYEQLNLVVVDTGVELIAVNFNPTDASSLLRNQVDLSDSVRALAATISLGGSAPQLTELVARLENSRRVFNIVGLSMFRDQDAEPGVYRMEIQAELYYWEQFESTLN